MTVHRNWNGCLLALALSLTIVIFGTGASAQGYTDIHDFNTPLLAAPQYPGLMAQGRDGNLYGTAPLGGDFGRGGVFMITPGGSYSVIKSFDSSMANPYSGLTLGSDGNFYGATFNGGAFLFGTVYQMTPGGLITVLHSFTLAEGAGPYAPPIQGTDGNFYGTVSTGGAGVGAVYRVTSAGAFSVLYTFDGPPGAAPIAPLIQGKDGNFYGTTRDGGTAGFGTAYKITPAGVLTVLYNFDGTHGSSIYAPLLQGSDGNFYGTARTGGSKNNGGVVFKLTAGKKLTVLYNFDGTGATADGVRPYAGLIQTSDGHFYGLASAGGTNGGGILFEILSTGLGYKNWFNFASASGSLPFATLKQHTNGLFYGEATMGGVFGHGALYNFSTAYPPFVTLQQTSGLVGQTVSILGQGLTGTNTVKFNGVASAFTVVSDTYISAIVPSGATSGFVKTTGAGGGRTSSQKFLVTPVVLHFSPTSGTVGTQVVITGNSFKGATKVSFGSTQKSTFTVDSYTQITATVPTGGKTGKIQVTTPGGIASSGGSFTVN